MYNCIYSLMRKKLTNTIRHPSYRFFHIKSPLTRAYEAEGKTSANILNNDPDLGLMINAFSQLGFRLNNGITVLGPMAIFPRSVLSWNVHDPLQITEESLCLFTVLEPKLDIIVIGTGDKTFDVNFYKKLLPFMHKHKLTLEILPTDVACATFNFLNGEGRYVVGALLPPQDIKTTDDDILDTKLRYHNLYEIEE